MKRDRNVRQCVIHAAFMLGLLVSWDHVHADLFTSDNSWLIPIGVGLDYALTESLNLTSTFLLNFTDVDTGRGTDAHVMPGLTFGLRF